MYREIVWTDEAEDHIARHRVRPNDVEELVNSRPMTMARKHDELREYYDRTDTSERLADAVLEQPDAGAEAMVTYALRLPKPVLDGLRAAAEARGVRVSALMRTWLEERLGGESGGQHKVVAVDDILALLAERAHPAA